MTPAESPQDGPPDVENHVCKVPPAILAIDTTSEFGGVALRAAGRIVAQRRIHAPDGFSQVLFSELEQLLGQAAFSLSDIDCFAAAAGPGSFTGVRIGLAAAKGLAEAARKPIAPISNLRALATFGSLARRITLLDARRGEVYAAIYDQHLDCVSPETVVGFKAFLESLGGAFDGSGADAGSGAPDVEFITFSGAPFAIALAGTPWGNLPWVEAPRGLAAAVALCAELDFLAGRTVDPLVADANYVRRSDAEILWNRR
jgi:tRNA threonylcarbamoyladenosine biosynthesis protein TsaB